MAAAVLNGLFGYCNRHSREAAQECSPGRKPGVNGFNHDQAPKERKNPSARINQLRCRVLRSFVVAIHPTPEDACPP